MAQKVVGVSLQLTKETFLREVVRENYGTVAAAFHLKMQDGSGTVSWLHFDLCFHRGHVMLAPQHACALVILTVPCCSFRLSPFSPTCFNMFQRLHPGISRNNDASQKISWMPDASLFCSHVLNFEQQPTFAAPNLCANEGCSMMCRCWCSAVVLTVKAIPAECFHARFQSGSLLPQIGTREGDVDLHMHPKTY